jgi:hypothetical protein
MNLDQTFPGMNRAIEKTRRIEAHLRDVALLPVGEVINGIPVEQFKFKHYKVLVAIESPFLFGGKRDHLDVGTFMWIVSGKYDPGAGTERDQYIKGVLERPNGARFFRAIQRYLDRAMFDTPPSWIGKTKLMATSVSVGIAHKIMFAYKCRLSDVDEMTVSAIFQFLKWIEVERDRGYPQFNPLSDRIKQKAMDRANRKNGHNGG